MDPRRPSAAGRGRKRPQRRLPSLRTHRRGRSPRPLGDGAAHDRPPRPPPLHHGTRRPRASHSPRQPNNLAHLHDHLDATTKHTELTVGYRVPAPILDYANQLLTRAAPHVTPPTSARTRGHPPRVLPVTDTQRPTAVSNEVDDLLRSNTSLAVVTPQSLFDETAAALDTLGAAYADGQKTLALGEHITLLLPTNTKGLEFDAVIVIEPGRIASENEHVIWG